MLAFLCEKDDIKIDQPITSKSIISDLDPSLSFKSSIIKEKQIKNYRSFTVQIQGNAYMTGFHNWVLDLNDPLNKGFLI